MNPFQKDRRDAKINTERIVLRDDSRLASGKMAFFQWITVGVFVFLLSGFWKLQVQNPGYYQEAAERNRIKSLPILAPRGKILDRDGRVIVDNQSSFRLILSRENLKQEHLKVIAEGLDLDYGDLLERLRRYASRPRYEPMVLKEELTQSDLAFVESHRDSETFPEMELIQSHRRLYPEGGFAAHLLGYTGEISENELYSPEFAKYDPGAIIGKAGIERQYNDWLTGVDGSRQVVVDNRGREHEVLGLKEAVPGKDLELTIDLDLQAVAELAMDGKRGAVVALDPRNGEVLAMVSRPAFDPNKFTGRIRRADWKQITDDPGNPMLNRAIQAQLAPGSTFKPIMALAGLEQGIIDDNFRVHCSGGATFYGRYFKCHLKRGHGTVDVHKAITQSCDVFFYTVGNRLGIDHIAEYAQLAGMGEKTGIDLPNEVEGVVPSTKWKLRNFRQKWYAGETISVAIGQGALTVTPLQLAEAIAGIADGGRWIRPHMLKLPSGSLKIRQGNLNPDSIAKVIYGMYGVVNEYGTGVRARLAGYDVCGKTGTAQLASNQYLKGKTAKHLQDNAWFVGFAPRQAPEIVVVALFENGEHGQLAAPIVRDVIKAYFDKKIRLQKSLRAATTPSALPAVMLGGPAAVTPASRLGEVEATTTATPKNAEIVELRE